MFDKGVSFKSGEYANSLPPKSIVCEIGCGHGKNLIGFTNKGFDVIGIDPDPKAVETTKANGIMALLGTAENLPLEIKAGSVDFILMSHSLEHCLNPQLALTNTAKALKPGGVFVCEVPNSACTHFLWNNICSEMLDLPRHLHFFNTKSLSQAIRSSGLNIHAEQYCGFTRHHSKDWREQRFLYIKIYQKYQQTNFHQNILFLDLCYFGEQLLWPHPKKNMTHYC